MAELVRLDAGHAKAVLAFEVENRPFFARTISDRGDAYFDRFADGFDALLAEQAAGVCVFSVLIDEDGSVLGRFNLVDIEDGSAVLGYRVAERATGRGVATTAVRELCEVARAQLGLRSLRAAVAHTNAASQRVLVKAGFILVGPADPADIGGKAGVWFQRDLLSEAS